MTESSTQSRWPFREFRAVRSEWESAGEWTSEGGPNGKPSRDRRESHPLSIGAADKAKDMAAVAADKARETTEKTKISVAIAGEQREIEKNCRLIGEWFINEYEGELPEGVQELADAVAASKARIAELEEQKNAIKVEHSEVSAAEPGMKICPVCGAESDSKFCPKCGAPMD